SHEVVVIAEGSACVQATRLKHVYCVLDFCQAMKGWFLSSYLLGVGWVGFVRCVIFGMKKELRSRNLLKNHALSQAISDVGWRSFLNMLAYKADLYGKEFLTIDP